MDADFTFCEWLIYNNDAKKYKYVIFVDECHWWLWGEEEDKGQNEGDPWS